MTKYEKIENEITGTKIIRWQDQDIIRFIPEDLSNSDYQAYLKYISEQTE